MSEPPTAITNTVKSLDGTTIAFHTMGSGPGLVIVGGVLSDASNYLRLAEALAHAFTVHVIERRSRPGSGAQRPGHSIDDECDDLTAVARATNSRSAFGHSFGGLVTLETARRRPIFDHVAVYEPGVPLRGGLATGWLDGYRRRLEAGDRRGAFAWMVKSSGFAPKPVAAMPLGTLSLILRLGIRGEQWERIDRLLGANLVEHELLANLDAPNLDRFDTITAHVLLMAGTRSPNAISGPLLDELAVHIPSSRVTTLSGLAHAAPETRPSRMAAALLLQ
jgi:pimeloyl-ACP methyl ester carboxylesterase